MKLFRKIIFGCLISFVLVFVFFFLLMSALVHFIDWEREMQGRDYMTKLGIAIDGYRQDHKGAYPPDYNNLNQYSDSFLKSFLDQHTEWIKPAYRIPDSNEPKIPISWTSRESKSWQNPDDTFSKCVYLFADGSVEVLESEEFIEMMRKHGIIDPNILNQN